MPNLKSSQVEHGAVTTSDYCADFYYCRNDGPL